MRYLSTASASPPATLRQALLAGPAPDGGLYLPEHLRPLSAQALAAMAGASFPAVALAVAQVLLGDDISATDLKRLVAASLDFEVPLVPVENGIWALELFHGPTLAFKDIGARFMAQLMLQVLAPREKITILVATSGDTGSAVAQAYHDLDGIQVVVLFPQGKVSPLQQRQFTTLGGNIRAVAVEGVFDDCQRLVQAAFADAELRRRLPLASANSINIGRLLPQTFYYFHAAAQLPGGPGAVLFSTPSGNFGNLTAGLMARRLGLNRARFVAATNVNDVVPVYLKTGELKARPSQPTLSNAMDVGDPSNMRRILQLYGNDVEALRRDVQGSSHADGDTRDAMADLHQRTAYVADPHSAVGYLGLMTGLKALAAAGEETPPGVFLATAHPAKFAPLVEEILGTAVPLPPPLAACLRSPEQVEVMAPEIDALRALLLRE